MTLPNFLIIGAQKAGTTALHFYLKQHPQIYMSPVKEPHFFTNEGGKLESQGSTSEKLNLSSIADVEAYWRQNRSSCTDIEAYRALFGGVSNETAIGESSTLYLYSSKAPERIQHTIPNVKLIAMLRDPVERAYSAFLYLVRDGKEPLTDFAQALQEEEIRIRSNWEPNWHYRQRGLYHAQLKRYFDRFDRGQVRVYLYEDFNANPIDTLQDIFRFLGVDDTFTPDVTQRYNVSGVYKSKALHSLQTFLLAPNLIKSTLRQFLPKDLYRRLVSRKKSVLTDIRSEQTLVKPKLLPEVREQLIQAYREDILKLQDLIQRDLSEWLR